MNVKLAFISRKDRSLNNLGYICKELTISIILKPSFQGVKEIEEMWNNMKFTVVPYMKGPSMRGYILGAIDEIVQNLDDSSMNLQSMSASRFVGPFLNSVQNWEKSLSHISEVLDVSCRI